jgi:hypothetical protein
MSRLTVRGGVTIAVAALVVTVATGCSSPREDAERQAVEEVRHNARFTAERLARMASEANGPKGEELLDEYTYHHPLAPRDIVFDKEVGPDGELVLRVAFHGFGEAQEWLFAAQQTVVARLCAEVRIGADASAELLDTACAPNLPDVAESGSRSGKVDVVVKLR